MTEEEYKFLEVIYNRGSIQEQPYINYLNGSLPQEVSNKDQYIQQLFSKFREDGFIDKPKTGIYKITELGKEKFEELVDRKEFARKMDHLVAPKPKFRLGGHFWLALIILIIIVSVLISMVLNRWQYLSQVFHKVLGS